MSIRSDTGPRGRPSRGPARLRVGVNLTWLVPGVVGGSEEYLIRSLLALPTALPTPPATALPTPRTDQPNLRPDESVGVPPEVTVFGLDVLAEAYPILAERFELVTLPLRGRLKGARVAAESTWLAVEARRRSLDVVHHGGGVLPLWAPARTVVTIHDLQPVDFPAAFGRVKRNWLALMLPRTARRADLVVTTSDFVRRGVIDAFGTPAHRVHLVPPCLAAPDPAGCSGAAASPDPAAGSSAPPPVGQTGTPGLAAVRRRYGIDGRYVVYPAITYAHKNHIVLLDAVATDAWPSDLHLVLPGGSAPAEVALAARIEALAPQRRRLVHRLGRIPRPELDVLVAGAEALAFPSTYEGFGIGALEGLAAGTPVVAARAGALPEVVGGAGSLLDPHDPSAWAAELARLAAAPPAERDRLAAAGRAVAAASTPARTGAALVGAWYRAATEAPRRLDPSRGGSS